MSVIIRNNKPVRNCYRLLAIAACAAIITIHKIQHVFFYIIHVYGKLAIRQTKLRIQHPGEYSLFISDTLNEVLESYAVEYAADHSGTTANALIINYIRTGVEKYTKDSWQIMAGAENKEFTAFVQEKDAQNHTTASDLKHITEFTLPNGNTVDFQHMFGTMDIISYTKGLGGNQETVTARSDMPYLIRCLRHLLTSGLCRKSLCHR